MNLLIEHENYIEELKQEFYSVDDIQKASKCMLECSKPQIKGLLFAFTFPPKEMYVMDTVNNLKKSL